MYFSWPRRGRHEPPRSLGTCPRRRPPLATHALKTSGDPFALQALRYLDLVVLAVALIVFVAAGFPLLGWAAATAAWLSQRGLQVVLTRKVRATVDPRAAAGILSASLLARVWFLALVVLVVGLIE